VAWRLLELGVRGGRFFSDDVIGGDELAVVRFNSLSTGVYHFST
jgi:hypothetical protein